LSFSLCDSGIWQTWFVHLMLIRITCIEYFIIILYINLVKLQVLRRWRHRLHKSGNELPFRYQQITKLIEIGLLCQEEDPYKRPFINDIINDMNKLESVEREISFSNKSTVGQVISCAPHNFHSIVILHWFLLLKCICRFHISFHQFILFIAWASI
jgi:hypothetical protein